MSTPPILGVAHPSIDQQNMLLALLSGTVTIANRIAPPSIALHEALDQIAAHIGWPVLHVYLPLDPAQDLLAPAPIWHLDSPQKYAHFRHTTDQTYFQPGLGLVGQVQATARPIWAPDVATEPRFIRRHAGSDLGVHAGILFPLLIGDEVVGVMECYSAEVIEPDLSLLEVLAHVGIILGRVIERARTQLKEQREQCVDALQLQHARQAAARELITMIAHEVNNPLYAARNALELIKQDLEDSGSPFVDILSSELARIAAVMVRIRNLTPT